MGSSWNLGSADVFARWIPSWPCQDDTNFVLVLQNPDPDKELEETVASSSLVVAFCIPTGLAKRKRTAPPLHWSIRLPKSTEMRKTLRKFYPRIWQADLQRYNKKFLKGVTVLSYHLGVCQILGLVFIIYTPKHSWRGGIYELRNLGTPVLLHSEQLNALFKSKLNLLWHRI